MLVISDLFNDVRLVSPANLFSFFGRRIPAYKSLFALLFSLFFTQVLLAQGNVGIGTSNPDNNAVLDITSTSKGVLFPRLSTLQRDAIPDPIPISLTIFNTTTNCLEFYVGSKWHPIACPCEKILSPPAATAGTNVAPYSFTANWQATLGATGYYLDVATDAEFTDILPDYNNLGVGALTSLDIKGLNCAATYYYRVRSYERNCTSDHSNIISVYTRSLSGKQVFAYTGSEQTFVVPCGINSIQVKIWAAGGGGNGGGESGGSGGGGAFVSGTYSTTGGANISVIVGGGGASNRGGGNGTPGATSYGGGGTGFRGVAYNSGSGGGLSAIASGAEYVAVAGGGGGGGSYTSNAVNANRPAGGPGGSISLNGYDGGTSSNAGGRRGSSGGAGGSGSSVLYNGTAGSSGLGGNGRGALNGNSASSFGGGGGGGYPFGGGGGGGSAAGAFTLIGGGGGGSSFTGGSGFSGIHTPAALTSRLASNPPPNTSDTDYVPGVGTGGGANGFNDGGNGLIIISW